VIRSPADSPPPPFSIITVEFRRTNSSTGNFSGNITNTDITVSEKDDDNSDVIIILAAVFGTLGGIILIAGSIYAYRYFKRRNATGPSVSTATSFAKVAAKGET
jgi:hypothetical protein